MKNKIKIMYIEDDLRDPLKNLINEFGDIADFSLFDNATDGLVELDSLQPALILLDLKIPWHKNGKASRENGVKVLEELSKNQNNYIIPTIVITQFPIDDEPVEFGRRYKLWGYLDKGMEYKKRMDKIRMVIEEIRNGKNLKRNRYCEFIGDICDAGIQFKGINTSFLAYSSDGRFAGFMKELKKTINATGILEAFDWLDTDPNFNAPSSSIFCHNICDRIFSRNIFIANVTDQKPNVFFEWGFALGIGRISYPIFEENSEDRLPQLFRAQVCFPYKNTDVYNNFDFGIDYLKNCLYGDPKKTFRGLKNPECLSNNILLISPDDNRHKEFVAGWLQENINKTNGFGIERIAIGDEPNILYYLNKIKAHSKIIIDLLSDDDENNMHNIPIYFFTGFAIGLGKKVLLIKERELSKPLIDMHQILRDYSDISELSVYIDNWINKDSKGN
jgi:CheY-like chemotaxis protein